MRLFIALAIGLVIATLMILSEKHFGLEKTLIIYHFVVCLAIGFLSQCKIKL